MEFAASKGTSYAIYRSSLTTCRNKEFVLSLRITKRAPADPQEGIEQVLTICGGFA